MIKYYEENFNSTLALLIVAAALFLINSVSDFTLIFTIFILLASVVTVLVPDFRVLSLVLFTYIAIGMLPISDYRGIVTEMTLGVYSQFYLWLVAGFLIAKAIFASGRKNNVAFLEVRWNRNCDAFFRLYLILVWACFAAVLVSSGNIIFNPELRFSINPALALLIKSGIYFSIFAICMNKVDGLKSTLYYVAAISLPSMLIGSRGNFVVVILSFIIFYVQGQGDHKKIKTSHLILALISVVAIVNVGFYLRRSGVGSFLTVDELIRAYFYYDNLLIYIVAPLHTAFRETIGLSNVIINSVLFNDISKTPLFLLELVTVFPGEQMAPGKVLGELIGVTGAGGLTPGLIGGLFIDFGISGVIIFSFLSGFFMGWLAVKSKSGIFAFLLFCLTVAQFVHLFHRGFMKPEYVFSYILLFALFFIQKKDSQV